jgi:hypothetical protein
MISTINVGRHDVIVRPIQQDLPEELNTLALRNVGVGLDKDLIIFGKEELKIGSKISGN